MFIYLRVYFYIPILLLFGLSILFIPETALSQGTPGCCLNVSNYCAPELQVLEEDCPFPNEDGGSFVPNQTCAEDGVGCVDIPPEAGGCCNVNDMCSRDMVTKSTCDIENGTFFLNRSCNRDGVGCTIRRPIPRGCCQITQDPFTCGRANGINCVNENGAFVVGGSCRNENEGQCDPLPPVPLGCCVISQGVCSETEISQSECEDDRGMNWVFNTECSEVPECIVLPRNVPSLSHWGLIALAGILGLISLVILNRKKASI